MYNPDCGHVRVRNIYDDKMDVETFIKELEREFELDIRALPQWKELVENMYMVQTDYKRKIQRAGFRKSAIINKLFIQNTRPSPFQLTEGLARTDKLWKDLQSRLKPPKVILTLESDLKSSSSSRSVELAGEVSDLKITGHPNTEVILSVDMLNVKVNKEAEDQLSNAPQLPINICTNQHKFLSPLDSNFSKISFRLKNSLSHELQTTERENLILNSTNMVNYSPNKIILTDNRGNNSIIKIYLTNRTTEYLHVQYKNILDSSHFANHDIKPKIAVKLYPGLPTCFKFYFKLTKNMQDFTTFIYFRVSSNVLYGLPEELLYIPIVTNFTPERCILVSKNVYIPPVYLWQISFKHGFPKGALIIRVKDDFFYHLHIKKRTNLSNQYLDESITSFEGESIEQQKDDKELETHRTSTVKEIDDVADVKIEEEDFTNEDVISKVLNDIVDNSLGLFLMKNTFLRLSPQSHRLTKIYFTKAENIGFHQCLYDLEFYDPHTDILILTKTIKVYAEVLPNPIDIQPIILDMSLSPVIHGRCSDKFIITNKNKVYTFSVKIKTTTKMNRIFSITPIDTVVLPQSSTTFNVSLCSNSLNYKNPETDKAYFIVKLIIKCNVSTFKDMPPFFYEIIAPCISEFKKVYNVTSYDFLEQNACDTPI